MRSMLALVGLLAALAISTVQAQQSAIATFDVPNTCVVAGTLASSTDPASTCVPTGFRIYRNNTLVGAIASGGSIQFPANGTFTVGIEPYDADGPGPRVNKQVVVGPPPTVPGPVRNFTLTAACATTTPVSCTFTVTDAP